VRVAVIVFDKATFGIDMGQVGVTVVDVIIVVSSLEEAEDVMMIEDEVSN
jgi:sulfur relay (sulfurtransferase) DsrF/TusC family protein